ncbi:MAG: hypothetical protein ACRDJX_07870 [Solirubrobacteraceae bacterium]
MRRSQPQWVAHLATADPVAHMVIDEQARAEAWRVVSAAIGDPATQDAPTAPRRGWRWLRMPTIAIGAVLAIVGAAFASGLVGVGSPAQKVESFQTPASGFGTVVPGSAKVLAVSAADPQSGPPWGLRVFTTSRGAGCVQLGRVVNGQLGVLGIDGAYKDDGLLHPLAVASADELTCSALDANGRTFANVSKGDQLANGLIGPENLPSRQAPAPHEGCAPAAATPAEKSSAQGQICPASEERDIYYGLLGPDAESVTYSQDGKTVTDPTSGAEGAYLIVTDAPSAWQPNDAYGPGETGVVPVYGPITEIHYASGAVCHPAIPGEPACAPGGIPIGFVPAEPTPNASAAAAPVSSQLVPLAGDRYEAVVSFKAPLAISSVRDNYKLRWHKQPGDSESDEESVNISEADVAAGQELTIHTGVLPSGSTALHVVLQHAGGPALLEGPGTVYVAVGTTTVTVPLH